MSPIVLVAIFLTFTLAMFAIGAAFLAPSSTVGARLHTLLGRKKAERKRLDFNQIGRVLEPVSGMLPKSEEEVSDTRDLLRQAGYREARHLTMFFSLRLFSVAIAVGLTLVTGLAFRSPLLAFAAAALGYILPKFALKRKITARQTRIQLGLPDALDLAIICVEAGLGLDQTLDRVGTELRNSHPDLADEMMLVNLEIRAGRPRAEALRNFATRTGVDDVRAFVAVLIQTERFGTSVATALRVHSDALRTERRQRAEERAAKTTIKMVPVLVMFIFPVMFVVILGPVVIGLIRDVLPAIKK
ncbi:MAG: type II secretion system F family protein [Terriglobales bacterium]